MKRKFNIYYAKYLFERFQSESRLILSGKFHSGFCTICEKRTIFVHRGKYLREKFRCIYCDSFSRWRALVYILNKYFPNYRDLAIHESSPSGSVSDKLLRECKSYTPSHSWQNVPKGDYHEGIRCENLEKQTFSDQSFDIVITQDVFEHVLNPDKAFVEIERTLKPNGVHLFTVPWNKNQPTFVRVKDSSSGFQYFADEKFHGNPIDPSGSLVITDWGDNLVDYIYSTSSMKTKIFFLDNSRYGFIRRSEVFLSYKPQHPNLIINNKKW